MKTNAQRLLELKQIPHEILSYPVDPDALDAVTVALAVGLEPERIFKTLVARGSQTGPVVFCIPGPATLDLKKAAEASGNKKVEMLPLKELLPLTGYVHGGCSPLGMKKVFPFWLDETAELFETVGVSAGARGLQMLIAPKLLLELAGGTLADLTA